MAEVFKAGTYTAAGMEDARIVVVDDDDEVEEEEEEEATTATVVETPLSVLLPLTSLSELDADDAVTLPCSGGACRDGAHTICSH